MRNSIETKLDNLINVSCFFSWYVGYIQQAEKTLTLSQSLFDPLLSTERLRITTSSEFDYALS